MNKWRDLGDVGAVGIELVLSIAVGYYAGRWLDGRFFGAHGYATFVGFLFGVFAGFKAIYEASKRMQRRLDQIEREEAEQAKRARQDERGSERRDGANDDDPHAHGDARDHDHDR